MEILRKASKLLMPSEKPFFSAKAFSSSPWSANPFMRNAAVHRSITVLITVENKHLPKSRANLFQYRVSSKLDS